MSLAFHNAPQIFSDDEDENDEVVEDLFFTRCCSNPYGKLPIILAVLSCVTFLMSSSAATSCDLYEGELPIWTNSTNYTALNGTSFHWKFGLYTYEISGLSDDCDMSKRACDQLDGYIENTQCVPYPPGYDQDMSVIEMVRTFNLLAGLFALIACHVLLISTCFVYRQRSWWAIAVILLLASLFDALVLIWLAAIPCPEGTLSCGIFVSGLATGATISSSVLYFILAIGCGYLAKFGKRKHSSQMA